MKKLERAAILVSLVKELREHNSWSAETNIQKASYFLQELTEVPLGLEFVLYKYGPYSFELANELTALRADSILTLQVRDPRYGLCYVPGELSDLLLQRFPRTVRRFHDKVSFVSERLGSKGVAELERLATALYVRPGGRTRAGVKARATEITKLKPHVSKVEAEKAVREVDKMFEEAKQLAEN